MLLPPSAARSPGRAVTGPPTPLLRVMLRANRGWVSSRGRGASGAPGIPEEEGQGHLACLITFTAAPPSPHGESEAPAHQQGPRAAPWSCPLIFCDWKGAGDKDKVSGGDAETGTLRHCWL